MALQTRGFRYPAAVDGVRSMEQTQDDAKPGGEGEKTPLQELVEDYLVTRRDEHGSGTYASSAASELGRWTDWMTEHGYDLEDLDGDDGPRILRSYAKRLRRRVQSGAIAATTAETYFAYVSACLSYAVREGRLSQNVAQTERARELLPEDSRDRGDQQHWTPKQRARLVEYATEQASEAIDEDGFDAYVPARDRALVTLLYYAAVRGAEVLRHPQDERDGRQGLRWKRVDLDAGTLRILGKDQSWETAPIPSTALVHLEQLYRVQRPASDDWPVFASDHAPSKWSAARDSLEDVEALVEEHGSIDAVLREYNVSPPPLTTKGARDVLARMTAAADIDVDEGYLKPHGARRGMIGEVYKRDRAEAQDLGRHKSMETTREAYSHLDAEAQRKRLDDLVAEFD